MSTAMSDERRRAFLMDGTRTGKLATIRRGGRAHVVPIWFVLDGDDVLFTTGAETVKGRALRRTGRACMCVDAEEPPYAYVMLEGPVVIEEDPDELRRWATLLGGRYMGEDRAEEFGRRNAVPGELLVRLQPERAVGYDGIAD
jgi:PPOX class probable F420-dependent enzyme